MKKITKRFLMLALCVIMVLSFAACDKDNESTTGGGGSAVATEGGGDSNASGRDTLNVAVFLDSGTLDPIGITGQGGFLHLSRTYMEPLIDFRQGAVMEYVLCESIDEVSDIQYTLHLREGVVFNNGNPFTAEDVIFSMEREKDDPSRMLDVQYVDFEKTNIIDDYTIDLWFTMYTSVNFIKLSQMSVCDAESFDAQAMSTNPVGTGAYKVMDYVVNSHVTVEARDDYWGDAPKIKNIKFLCLNEESQRTNALETGTVDYAQIPTKDVEYIESLGDFNIETVYPGFASATYFNMSPDSPLATKEARDAIAYAIDSQSISDLAHDGYGGILSWPVTMYAVDFEERFANLDDTYATGYDLAKAKEKAEAAGLVGKTLRIVTNGDEMYVTTAEIIQADLAQIGITLDITNYDQATYYSIIMDPSTYDIALYATSAPSMMAADILTNYPTFFTLGWNDAERLAYIDKGNVVLSTPNEAERSEKLFELTEEFLSYSPWFGICDIPTKGAVVKDIEGFEWWLTGDLRFEDWAFAS